ncbi:oligosaccharide flippase family protein [Thermus caldilimi]|uniref:oligosaccharide flippase family protein n=1 Tax=Thermus caldilimi TaxID=2483360 RepID=UPI001076B68E|nr:oligosaccharide flippase family protein [Thermus caldilimi]
MEKTGVEVGKLRLKFWSTGAVVRDAISLYALLLFNFVIPLITLPYLSRVLGPQVFGLLTFFQAFALWASVVIEYGLNLWGVREGGKAREDSAELGRLAAGILAARLVLLAGVLTISIPVAFFIPIFKDNLVYVIWSLIQAIAFGFSPFWYFQSTGKITQAVALEFCFRLIATTMVLLFVDAPQKGWLVLALQGGFGMVTTLIQLAWVHREVKLPILFSLFGLSLQILAKGRGVFLLRLLQVIYSSNPVFLLGITADPLVLGYYGGADKLYKALLSVLTPVVQAVYPRVADFTYSNPGKNHVILRQTKWLLGMASFVLAGIVLANAHLLIAVFLGHAYMPSIAILRILSLSIPLNAFNSALMMFHLLPHGMEVMGVRALLLGVVVHVIGILGLGSLYAGVGAACTVVSAELLVFTTLWLCLIKRRCMR